MSAVKKPIVLTSLWLLLLLPAACRLGRRPDANAILKIEQIKAYSNAELPAQVRFQGVVTVVDANFGFFIVQDETGGIKVEPSHFVETSMTGHRVEITGSSQLAAGADTVSGARVRDLGMAALPKPVPITSEQLQANTFDRKRVIVSGTARVGHVDATGQLVIPLNVGGFEVFARLMEDQGLDSERLVDAVIRVTGVASTGVDIDGKLTDLTILAPNPKAIQTLEAAPAPASLAVRSVKEILSVTGKLPEHRVRLRGRIEKTGEGETFRFGDGSGSIALSSVAGLDTSQAGPIDIVAFMERAGGGGWALADVRPTFGANPATERGSSARPITSVAELHGLTSQDAALERPVSLEGIVTYYDPDWQMMFLQDPTAGVFISLHGVTRLPALKVGDRVRIHGVSGAGDFAPVVQMPRFQFLGSGSLPNPERIDAESIFSGLADSQWVELQGIVQSLELDGNHPSASLSWGSHNYKIIFPPSVKLTPDWIDAGVIVRGAAGTLFNGSRQVLGIQLFVQGLDQLDRLRDSGTAGGRLPPVMAIDKLLQFDPNEMPGHRVQLRGKVLATRAEGPTWIKDDTGAVVIREHNEIALNDGDIVDVAGFAFPGEYSAEIHDGFIRKLSSGPPATPIDITPERALFQGVHGQLVRLDGRLISEYRNGQEQTLLLRNGKATFTVRGMGNLPVYETGAVLRVTGICNVRATRYRAVLVPTSFEIAVDSPASVIVLRNAPWLTEQRAWRVLALTCLLVAGALEWAFMLRRRVRGQTRFIEQKLVEVEKLKEKAEAASEAKSRFLANMSHEIRTPMNGILGMTELAMQAESPEEQRECLSTLRSSGDALLSILNDLLDLSKIEAGKFEIAEEPFSIRELLSDAGKVFAHRMREKGLRFESSAADSLPDALRGDALRLRQILLNLLGNAVKFTEAGLVSLTAAGEQEGDRVHLRLVVRDTGIGISTEKQGRIFEAFRQADDSTAQKYGGTGLGLSICVKLVALMGGKIAVQSEPGQGSAFSVHLVLKPAPPHEAVTVALPEGRVESLVKPLRILLAEDNLVNQTVAARLLKKHGHVVTIAGNGRLALDEFGRSAFDLVLMDIQMPVMDGLDAAREIRLLERSRKTRVPIIAMTAQTMAGDRESCFSAGMDAFVSKPIRLPELWAAISEVTSETAR
jgi:signal transduction histidine kinase/ActR/RegA family two-component response regulator